MAKPKIQPPTVDKCFGGNSFACKRFEHALGKIKNITCMTCHQRMGCSLCCQIPRELLCLNCHDWAHPYALAAHGHVVILAKAQRQIQSLVDNPPF